jgi:hypothetical protein
MPNNGAGIKYDVRPTDNEYWMYGVNISVATVGIVPAGTTAVAIGLQNCTNIVSPTITGTGGISVGSAGSGYYNGQRINGDTYGLYRVAQLHGYNPANVTATTAKLFPDYWLSELTTSGTLLSGVPLFTVTWDFLDINDEHPIKSATLAVSYDNGSTWTNLYSGTNKSFTFAPEDGADSMLLRIKDTATWEIVSEPLSVVLGVLPVISGTDAALGTFSATFTPYTYHFERDPVSAVEWTGAVVTERRDNAVVKTFTGQINTNYSLGFTNAEWRKILNGEHTLRIDVANDYGTVSRSLTFTKNEDTIKFKMAEPTPSANRPAQIQLPQFGNLPTGSTLLIEACNNGFDETPVWEDVTAAYTAGQPHVFDNQAKTDPEWGVNIRVTITRGAVPAGTPVDVDEVVVNWE